MRGFVLAGMVALLATPALAQGPGRMAPPPDHWMTFDSLVQAVSLTDAQKPDVQKHYDAINAVMKKLADQRRAMREQMMVGGGPPGGGGMQGMREQMQGMQTELDGHVTAVRGLLTAEQQVEFDTLEKPRLMGGPGMGRPPGA